MRKKWRKGLLITALLLSVMLIFAGCEDPISALTAAVVIGVPANSVVQKIILFSGPKASQVGRDRKSVV